MADESSTVASDTSDPAETSPDGMPPIDVTLLERLRCPLTLSELDLEEDEAGEFLVARVGGLRYPVTDGIPQMLPEEAALPEGVASLDELKKSLRQQGETVRD